MGKPRARLRRVLFGILVALGLLGSVPGYFFVRARYFPPTFAVASIRGQAHYQDPALLERAWQLPVARTFRPVLVYQTNGSRCGPSSLSNIQRSLGVESSESAILDGSGKCWTGICLGGLTLDEVGELAEKKTGRKVTLVRPASYEEFRSHLPKFNDPSRRYLANFQRGLLFGQGVGHHSPIGGYLDDRDLVLVLDVNAEFEPWLVEPRRLFDAIDSIDSSSGRKRGLLIIE